MDGAVVGGDDEVSIEGIGVRESVSKPLECTP